MNVTRNEIPTVDNALVEPHFYIDAEGNRVEIPFEVNDGQTYSGGETSPEETTLFVAEDSEDHPVTVH